MLQDIFAYNQIIDVIQQIPSFFLRLCAYEGIYGCQDGRVDVISEGRIFASRKSLENADFGFSAKRFGSSYSCTLPLDKTRIL